ncbi:MAG: VWA domain-containing protein [Bryobacterales bacterium]|nr:VWA domain-containing protein [Bryobacterales bacterium]
MAPRRTGWFGFLLLIPALTAQDKAAQDKQDAPVVFRSDVALIRVDAQVLDRQNRAITGLTRDDFVLRDEGQIREIRNFASEDMPADVLLLLDVSRSMRPHIERIANAANEAMLVLGKQDRVGIMVFDRETRVRLPLQDSFGDVGRELHRLLDQEHFNGGTDITRALYDAQKYLARGARSGARRAIVIVTDDQTERDRDDDGVTSAFSRSDIVLSAILAPDAMGSSRFPGGGGGGTRRSGGGWPGGGGGGLPSIIFGPGYPGGGGRYPGGGYPGGGGGYPGGGGGYPRGGGRYPGGGGGGNMGYGTRSAGTAEIAQRTGGDSLQIDDASALETTLSRIRQRYALHYYMPDGAKPSQERNIVVELSAAARRRYPDAQVHSRRLYTTGSDAGSTVSTNQSDPPVVVASGSGQSSTTSSGDSADETPRLKRRRPMVDEPSGSRTGPSSSSQSQGGWRRSTDPEPSTAPAAGAPSSPQQTAQPSGDAPRKSGGWRQATPEDTKP